MNIATGILAPPVEKTAALSDILTYLYEGGLGRLLPGGFAGNPALSGGAGALSGDAVRRFMRTRGFSDASSGTAGALVGLGTGGYAGGAGALGALVPGVAGRTYDVALPRILAATAGGAGVNQLVEMGLASNPRAIAESLGSASKTLSAPLLTGVSVSTPALNTAGSVGELASSLGNKGLAEIRSLVDSVTSGARGIGSGVLGEAGNSQVYKNLLGATGGATGIMLGMRSLAPGAYANTMRFLGDRSAPLVAGATGLGLTMAGAPLLGTAALAGSLGMAGARSAATRNALSSLYRNSPGGTVAAGLAGTAALLGAPVLGAGLGATALAYNPTFRSLAAGSGKLGWGAAKGTGRLGWGAAKGTGRLGWGAAKGLGSAGMSTGRYLGGLPARGYNALEKVPSGYGIGTAGALATAMGNPMVGVPAVLAAPLFNPTASRTLGDIARTINKNRATSKELNALYKTSSVKLAAPVFFTQASSPLDALTVKTANFTRILNPVSERLGKGVGKFFGSTSRAVKKINPLGFTSTQDRMAKQLIRGHQSAGRNITMEQARREAERLMHADGAQVNLRPGFDPNQAPQQVRGFFKNIGQGFREGFGQGPQFVESRQALQTTVNRNNPGFLQDVFGSQQLANRRALEQRAFEAGKTNSGLPTLVRGTAEEQAALNTARSAIPGAETAVTSAQGTLRGAGSEYAGTVYDIERELGQLTAINPAERTREQVARIGELQQYQSELLAYYGSHNKARLQNPYALGSATTAPADAAELQQRLTDLESRSTSLSQAEKSELEFLRNFRQEGTADLLGGGDLTAFRANLESLSKGQQNNVLSDINKAAKQSGRTSGYVSLQDVPDVELREALSRHTLPSSASYSPESPRTLITNAREAASNAADQAATFRSFEEYSAKYKARQSAIEGYQTAQKELSRAQEAVTPLQQNLEAAQATADYLAAPVVGAVESKLPAPLLESATAKLDAGVAEYLEGAGINDRATAVLSNLEAAGINSGEIMSTAAKEVGLGKAVSNVNRSIEEVIQDLATGATPREQDIIRRALRRNSDVTALSTTLKEMGVTVPTGSTLEAAVTGVSTGTVDSVRVLKQNSLELGKARNSLNNKLEELASGTIERTRGTKYKDMTSSAQKLRSREGYKALSVEDRRSIDTLEAVTNARIQAMTVDVTNGALSTAQVQSARPILNNATTAVMETANPSLAREWTRLLQTQGDLGQAVANASPELQAVINKAAPGLTSGRAGTGALTLSPAASSELRRLVPTSGRGSAASLDGALGEMFKGETLLNTNTPEGAELLNYLNTAKTNLGSDLLTAAQSSAAGKSAVNKLIGGTTEVGTLTVAEAEALGVISRPAPVTTVGPGATHAAEDVNRLLGEALAGNRSYSESLQFLRERAKAPLGRKGGVVPPAVANDVAAAKEALSALETHVSTGNSALKTNFVDYLNTAKSNARKQIAQEVRLDPSKITKNTEAAKVVVTEDVANLAQPPLVGANGEQVFNADAVKRQLEVLKNTPDNANVDELVLLQRLVLDGHITEQAATELAASGQLGRAIGQAAEQSAKSGTGLFGNLAAGAAVVGGTGYAASRGRRGPASTARSNAMAPQASWGLNPLQAPVRYIKKTAMSAPTGLKVPKPKFTPNDVTKAPVKHTSIPATSLMTATTDSLSKVSMLTAPVRYR